MARRQGTVRPITYLGNPVLRGQGRRVTEFDDSLATLVEDMFASMHAAEGVGLAANQIGVDLDVFVYDCPDDTGLSQVGHVVNPRLILADGEMMINDEGCLSVPGLYYPLARHHHAVVEGVDMHGEPLRIEGTGYFARCLQHETDHLKGTVYIDHLVGRTRRIAMKAIRNSDWAIPEL